MKRKRINLAAVASSEDYVASKRRHREWLEKKHKEFTALSANLQNMHKEEPDAEPWHPDTVTIKVLGGECTMPWWRYKELHCAELGFKRIR